MKRRTLPTLLGIAPLMVASLAMTCLATVLPAQKSHAQGLQVTYNSGGIATLAYNGVTLVNTPANGQDAFSVYQVEDKQSNGQVVETYSWTNNYTANWNAATQTLTWTYPWGTIACQYATPTSSKLTMTTTVTNTSSGDTINGVSIFPVALRFPNMPAGFNQNSPFVGFTSDGPNVQIADYGTGVVDVCNDDVVKNLYNGLFPVNNNTSPYTRFCVWTSSLPLSFQPPNYPVFDRPIGPGQSDTYTTSLRFGPEGTHALTLASDITANFAAAWPSTLHWSDHRSIGALFLATSQSHPATNPRGWFNNDPTVDVTTPSGITAFQQRVMQYATSSIAILKQMNAQGMIQWDVEGQQYPQPTSYIGDPTQIAALAPEMDGTADAYFQAFKNAGFQVGVTIRPQQFSTTPSPQQSEVSNPENLMATKINYARQRWGCTLFYVDSNGDTNAPYDANIFAQLAAAEPGVLIIPEHTNVKYGASTAPYGALTNGYLGTPAATAFTYPNAFSAIYTADGDMTENFNPLVGSVSRGDLLMFRGWFDDEPGNGDVRNIYQSANAGLPVMTSASSVSGNLGSAFSFQDTAQNGPYAYGATGLPGGLSISSAGLISGTPTASGVFTAQITATNWGGTGTQTLTITINPAVGTGLKGQYYQDPGAKTYFTSLKLTRTDPTVNFTWPSGTAPAPGLNNTYYSIKWTGAITALYSEVYQIHVTSDDGAKLWVNGQKLINNWGPHSPQDSFGTVTMTAGQQYPFELDYNQQQGGAQAKLEWLSNHQTRQVVPQSQLTPSL